MSNIYWIDEPYIKETDTDGNYSGVLVPDISRLVAFRAGKQIRFELVSIPEIIEAATIDEGNNIIVVIKPLQVDSYSCGITVRASTEGEPPVEKYFHLRFRKPRKEK